ncbi:hypothetical protein V8D89_006836 [Ganoderma adspersum]
MDRALSIAEIRYWICTLANDQTLAQLARCCNNFHEPAIRVLWSTIPDISLLVRCFPQDAWTLVPNPRGGDSIKLVRSLVSLAPQDWTAFLKYSNFVRKLGAPSSSKSSDHRDGRTSKLDPRALLEMSAYRPVFILFPNLVTFEWYGVQFPEEDLPVVLAFLNPNLTTVHIHIAEPHHDPGLLRTSLSAPVEDDLLLMPSILVLVKNLPTLEAFRCLYVPITEEVFVALASLQNLTLFAIRLPQMSAWSEVKIQPDCFPKLDNMIVSSRLEDYVKFSCIALFPYARTARIVLVDTPTENGLPRIFTSISSQLSPSALSKLIVLTQNGDQARRQLEQSSPVIRLDHLRPLFKFVNLTLFKFSVASSYALDGAAYLTIARAWPRMRTFELGLGKLCLHADPPAMCDVLVPFAIHCPKLVHLSVRFNGSDIKILEDGGIENPIPQGALSMSIVKTLDCFDSSMAEPPRVAAFLALLFPELEELVWKKPADGLAQPRGSWEEVEQYLPLFAAVREDGRRREAERQEQQRS